MPPPGHLGAGLVLRLYQQIKPQQVRVKWSRRAQRGANVFTNRGWTVCKNCKRGNLEVGLTASKSRVSKAGHREASVFIMWSESPPTEHVEGAQNINTIILANKATFKASLPTARSSPNMCLNLKTLVKWFLKINGDVSFIKTNL